jgi:hypothetical protein
MARDPQVVDEAPRAIETRTVAVGEISSSQQVTTVRVSIAYALGPSRATQGVSKSDQPRTPDFYINDLLLDIPKLSGDYAIAQGGVVSFGYVVDGRQPLVRPGPAPDGKGGGVWT